MNGVRAHYERLLGSIYAWSVSGNGDPCEQAAVWLAQRGLDGGQSYLDLGAGFGAHVVPLARAGKDVTAVEQDESLLRQLHARLSEEHLDASTWQGDLLDYIAAAPPRTWDYVLCLGDTLCHLESLRHVEVFLGACARLLDPHGALVLSYRDSTAGAGEGPSRLVQSARDSQRSLSCLLEVLDDEHLRVTDIFTELGSNGLVTRISDYIKILVPPAQVVAWATSAGLRLERQWYEKGFVVQVLRLAI